MINSFPDFAHITILGLGPGDPGQVTRQAWEILLKSSRLYVRTLQHPALKAIPPSREYHSFDDLYESLDSFQDVYDEIVKQILELGKEPGGVVYAVPGDPFFAEATSPEIVRQGREEGLTVRIIPGVSCLEPIFAALGVDPLPYSSLVDALTLGERYHPMFPPDAPALITQIYSQHIASEVKLTLMSQYPDQHPVYFVHGAGTADEIVEELPLYEMDRSKLISLLSSLYVPALQEGSSFEAFLNLIAHLRSPEGCPWDREQDHQSLRPNLLEETYEVLSALDADDPLAMQEELGDLLLQIVLHTQIAAEYGEFQMSEVIGGIYHKLVKRHPHVFAGLDLPDAGDVIRNWEQLKALERSENQQGNKKGVLDGVSESLPALTQAQTFQKRAARVGFDWPELEGVVEKISEEVAELQKANDERARADELGDLLFSIVNLARWLGIDAESALRDANRRFKNRFHYLEKRAREQGTQPGAMTLEEMDYLWEEAKQDSDPKFPGYKNNNQQE